VPFPPAGSWALQSDVELSPPSVAKEGVPLVGGEPESRPFLAVSGSADSHPNHWNSWHAWWSAASALVLVSRGRLRPVQLLHFAAALRSVC
jgi:hypothetical protein